MEMRFVLTTIFEIAVAAFIFYGLFHEEKFAEAERKAFGFLKARLTGSRASRSFREAGTGRF